jgi:4-amino-4-deoxychorismate lyase
VSAALGCWIDGVSGSTVPADDRGLHYGDGLFETLRIRLGTVRFLEAHLARLTLGCERLRISFAAMPELRAEIAAAARQAPPQAVLKVIVTRGSAIRRGYAPAGHETARRVVSLWPETALPAAISEGAALHVSSIRLAENPALAGIKHLSRIENVMAAREAADRGAFDAVLLDSSGRLISGAMTNLFIVRSATLLTPRVDLCGVAGVMRAIVIRECAALGIRVSEGRVGLQELFAADEAFITNARIGVVPVRRVGEHSFQMNDVARQLRAHLEPLDA